VASQGKSGLTLSPQKGGPPNRLRVGWGEDGKEDYWLLCGRMTQVQPKQARYTDDSTDHCVRWQAAPVEQKIVRQIMSTACIRLNI